MARSTDPIRAARHALKELDQAIELYRQIPMTIQHPFLTLTAMHLEHARGDLIYMLGKQPKTQGVKP